jgi:hypothetical protein
MGTNMPVASLHRAKLKAPSGARVSSKAHGPMLVLLAGTCAYHPVCRMLPLRKRSKEGEERGMS